MIKLSVIIPVYNVEKYLTKCLNSVLYPDIADYEVIVVNDGSTDSSPEIAENYARRYPELIKLINKENGGLGSARNAGISQAQGEFILFLDSDDSLSQNAVQEIIEAIDGSFDIGIFDFRSVNEDGAQLSYDKGCERDGCFTLQEYPELLFSRANAWNKLWRRSIFIESGIRYPDRLWFEDLATSPLLYLHADRIKYIPRPWYNYLIRQGSIMTSKKLSRNLEMIEVCDMVLNYYRVHGQYDNYKAQLEYMICYNELIAATVRVNLSDKTSTVQDGLLEYFLKTVPDYKDNPYIINMPPKYRLLFRLCLKKQSGLINFIMNLNNKLK